MKRLFKATFTYLSLLFFVFATISSCSSKKADPVYYNFALEDESYGFFIVNDDTENPKLSFNSSFDGESGKTEKIKAYSNEGYSFSHWEVEKDGMYYKISSINQNDTALFPPLSHSELEKAYSYSSKDSGKTSSTPFRFKACFDKEPSNKINFAAGKGVKYIVGRQSINVLKSKTLNGTVEPELRENSTFLGWYTDPEGDGEPVFETSVIDFSKLGYNSSYSEITYYAVAKNQSGTVDDLYLDFEVYCEEFIDISDEEKYFNEANLNKTFLCTLNNERNNRRCYLEYKLPETISGSETLEVNLQKSNGYVASDTNIPTEVDPDPKTTKKDKFSREYIFMGWYTNFLYSESLVTDQKSLNIKLGDYSQGQKFCAYFALKTATPKTNKNFTFYNENKEVLYPDYQIRPGYTEVEFGYYPQTLVGVHSFNAATPTEGYITYQRSNTQTIRVDFEAFNGATKKLAFSPYFSNYTPAGTTITPYIASGMYYYDTKVTTDNTFYRIVYAMGAARRKTLAYKSNGPSYDSVNYCFTSDGQKEDWLTYDPDGRQYYTLNNSSTKINLKDNDVLVFRYDPIRWTVESINKDTKCLTLMSKNMLLSASYGYHIPFSGGTLPTPINYASDKLDNQTLAKNIIPDYLNGEDFYLNTNAFSSEAAKYIKPYNATFIKGIENSQVNYSNTIDASRSYFYVPSIFNLTNSSSETINIIDYGTKEAVKYVTVERKNEEDETLDTFASAELLGTQRAYRKPTDFCSVLGVVTNDTGTQYITRDKIYENRNEFKYNFAGVNANGDFISIDQNDVAGVFPCMKLRYI